MGCITDRTSTPFNFISTHAAFDVNIADLGGDLSFCSIILLPPVLSLVANLEDDITISWIDPNTAITGFEIERNKNGGGFTLIHNAAAIDTEYNDTDLTVNDTVIYRIRTVNEGRKSLYSNEVSFELDQWIIQGGLLISGGILYPDEIL